MFWNMVRFEWKYWLKNPSFYVYLTIFFFLPLISMAGAAGAFGEGSANMQHMANAPLSIYSFTQFFTKLLLCLLPPIIGMSIYKDFKNKVHSILFTFPITKTEYLLAKFLSSFSVMLAVAFALEMGLVIGTLLPSVNSDQILTFSLLPYVQLYFVYLFPNLLVFGMFVFAIVCFTRNIYTGFIAVIFLWMIREILVRMTAGNAAPYLSGLLEPFGETASNLITRHWTLTEQNSLPLPMNPILFCNRLLWLMIGALIFFLVYRWFSFDQDATLWKTTNKKPEGQSISNSGSIIRINLPSPKVDFSFLQRVRAVWRLSNTDFFYIVKSGPFLCLLIAGVLFIVVLLQKMNPITDTKLLPVTWVILGFPVFFFIMLIQVLTFLYAGILVHRSRDARMADLIHTTPVSNVMLLMSSFLALLKIQLVLLTLIMVTGMAVQAFNEYYNFEIVHYLFDLFGVHLIGFIVWALAALFVQSLFTNAYLGLFVLILAALTVSNLSSLGIDSLIYQFNQSPEPDFFLSYSDLSKYGHSLNAYFKYKGYWLLFGILLCCLTLLFWQRSLTHSFVERIKLAGHRFKGYLLLTTVCVGGGLLAYGYYLYTEENRIENKSYSHSDENSFLIKFKQQYSNYLEIKQPRITSVFVNMDLFPETNSYTANGTYILFNRTAEPMDTLLIKAGFDEITQLRFDEAVTKLREDSIFKFSIFKLGKSLAPNDSIALHFSIKNKSNTLLTQYSNVLQNGTYLKSDIFPRLGDFSSIKKLNPEDTAALYNHYQSRDEDLVDFESVVSTSILQTAIAPGYLQRTWTKGDRKYFHYKMDKKIKFVFGFNSGLFNVFTARSGGIDLQIFHHPSHTYCLTSMIDGLKAALEYNTFYFGAYQHREVKIIEFSKSEGTYATTAANCIPISEIRFINDTKKSAAGHLDLPFYVAAHELSHQWWGNQVIPADVRGALMLTESVAEYITAKIYEKKYGKKSALKFLDIQLNRYLNGRATESGTETSLIYVQPDQSYIAYGKGSIAFYTMSEFIGEIQLNQALRSFLENVKDHPPPYTTSLELLKYIRKATPDSLQYLIVDLFETVDPEISLRHYKRLFHSTGD